MSTTTSVEYNDMTLPEAIQMQDQLHDDLEELSLFSSPDSAKDRLYVRNLLTQVQERIAQLTSLLTF